MTRSDSYNTMQKDLILKTIKNKKYEFTVKEIYEEVKNEVGLTTVYRLIDKLVDKNLLNKYISKDNTTYYQYLKECEKENHFYLKCEKCGELIHVDCDCIKDMASHIFEKHRFRISNEHIVINGLCKKCAKKGE